MIKRVESRDIDLKKFAELQRDADVFCKTAYFEPLCKFWCALVLNDYVGVIVIPYNKKGTYSWVVTPLFYRASAWLGTWSDEHKNTAINFLKTEFSHGNLNIQFTPFLNNQKVYQVISPATLSANNYNKLAKRMINKFEQQNTRFTCDLDIPMFVNFLLSELGGKVEGINPESMKLFTKLLISLQNHNMLKFEGVVQGGELLAGILIVETQNRHLYLKGTATDSAKKMGAYYALMNRAIQRAMEENVIFDFGGSSIQGVAQFNRNFGAEDEVYSNLTWGKQPFIISLLKRIKSLWN